MTRPVLAIERLLPSEAMDPASRFRSLPKQAFGRLAAASMGRCWTLS
jgi:hypothetical protein